MNKDAWSNKSDYRILLDDSSPLRPLELVAAISLAVVLIAVSFL